MITKITSAPVCSKSFKINCCGKKNSTPIYRDANTGDSITFTSKTPDVEKLVNDVFLNISKTRKNKDLGLIAGTIGKTNYSVRETKFGKQAELDIIRNGKHATFDIFRLNNTPVKIEESLDKNNSPELVKIVQRFISNK